MIFFWTKWIQPKWRFLLRNSKQLINCYPIYNNEKFSVVVEILKNGLKTSPTANTVSAPEPWNWRHKIAKCHLVCFLGSWLGTLIWSLWPPPPSSPQRSSWIPSGRPRLNRTSRRPRRRLSPRTTRTFRRGHFTVDTVLWRRAKF